ncbi:unnamed protein product (macronuclear) [Paramecium tetraurelia]|uniref:Transmembrane protein n=1 Tax=Paramecium tetraurelia TaxID=5888 RepID=A0D140_PARTE|nr:uncharacterized protein GSPATT00039172001 [Paramecium tetraurelia]CAK76757.1 unnamed protein product [Paramecium tetraurelia]|eukprot:XP_001444154.1 hypothetical protein (macronuclear) [Paramecium tetraurelia strain d4-2]
MMIILVIIFSTNQQATIYEFIVDGWQGNSNFYTCSNIENFGSPYRYDFIKIKQISFIIAGFFQTQILILIDAQYIRYQIILSDKSININQPPFLEENILDQVKGKWHQLEEGSLVVDQLDICIIFLLPNTITEEMPRQLLTFKNGQYHQNQVSLMLV